MGIYQQYPVEIDENSQFGQAIKQGAAVITVKGPNMQHGVPAGMSRLVAALAGNYFYGPMLSTMIKPVAPPFEPEEGGSAFREPKKEDTQVSADKAAFTQTVKKDTATRDAAISAAQIPEVFP